MTYAMRISILVASLVACTVVAVSAGVGNATEPPTVMELTFGDVVAQLEKAEALVHGKMTAGWSWILDTFSPFIIAGPLTFAFHEVVYFGAWMPWLLLDQVPYFQKYKIQPEKKADGKMVWKCLKRLLFSHLCIQFPMQLLFHLVAERMGFSMAPPLPPSARSRGRSPCSSSLRTFTLAGLPLPAPQVHLQVHPQDSPNTPTHSASRRVRPTPSRRCSSGSAPSCPPPGTW